MTSKQRNTNSPLPPLRSLKNDKSAKSAEKNRGGSKEFTDFMNIIAEGPFRKPLQSIDKMEIASPTSKHSYVDPHIFLKGRFFLYLP